MGARANYAILENGEVALFYSHWGALTIVEDLFWGPSRAESFVRKNERSTEWLDSVWAEGGFTLNKDQRALIYYASYWPEEPDLQEACDRLIAETWGASGWTVQRTSEWREIPDAAGVDPEVVTVRPTRKPIVPLTANSHGLDEVGPYGLIALATSNGWRDYVLGVDFVGILQNGPAMIGWLPELSGVEDLRAAIQRRIPMDEKSSIGDLVTSYGIVDPEAKRIRLSLFVEDEDQIVWIREAWPDWQVVLDLGGGASYFAHTGRRVPDEECVQIIREHVANTEERKDGTQAMSERFVQRLANTEGEGELQIARGLLDRVPSSNPSGLDRLRMAWRGFLRRRRRRAD